MASTAALDLLIQMKGGKEAAQQLDQVGDKGRNLGGVFGNLAGGASALLPVVGIIGGLGAALAGAVKAADDEQVGMNRLYTTVQNSIQGWTGNTSAIEGYIAKQQDLAFADDILRDSLGFLVGQTKNLQEAQDLQSVAMDLARAKNIDLMLATKAVGKVDNDSIGILKKLGIEVTDQMTKEQALAAIRQQTAGQAEAYANTTAGAMSRLQTHFGNVVESIGHILLPQITAALSGIADFVSSPGFQGAIENAMTFISGAFQALGVAIGVVIPIIGTIAGFIKDNFIPIMAALAVVIGPPLIGAIIALGTTMLTVAIPAAIATVAAFAPIILIAAAIGLAVAALKLAWDNNFLGMRDILTAVGNAIGTALGWIGDRIKDFLHFLGIQTEDGKQKGKDLGQGWVESGRGAIEAGKPVWESAAKYTVQGLDQSPTSGELGVKTGMKWTEGAISGYQFAAPTLINGVQATVWDAFSQGVLAEQLGRATGSRWVQGVAMGIASGSGPWSQVGGAMKSDITEMETGIMPAIITLGKNIGTTLHSGGVSAGKKLGEGVKKGAIESLADAKADIASKAREVANSALEQMKLALAVFEEGARVLSGIASIPALPSLGVLDAFFDALDAFTARASIRLQSYVGTFDTFKANFANAMGDTLAAIGKAVAPLAAIASIEALPSVGAIDAFFDKLDVFVARAQVRLQDWVGNFDEFKAKFANAMGDTLAAIGKTVAPLAAIAKLDTLPSAGVINAFFDALNEFINAFAAKSEDWATKIKDEVAKLATNIGTVTEGIGKALEPLSKMAEAQKVTPEQIEGALANVWLALHHFGEVMKSGELQGDRINEMVAFAKGIQQVFEAIRGAIDFLTDKANPDSIVMIWRDALNDMFLFTHNAWIPQTLDMFKTFFNTMTEMFNSYTANWVQTWKEAMNQLTPPGGTPPGGTTGQTLGGWSGGFGGHSVGGGVHVGTVIINAAPGQDGRQLGQQFLETVSRGAQSRAMSRRRGRGQ